MNIAGLSPQEPCLSNTVVMCEDLQRNPISQNHQIAGDDFTGNSAFMFALISLKWTNKLNNREAVHRFVKAIRFSYPKSIYHTKTKAKFS
jgi:hypothetical protein